MPLAVGELVTGSSKAIVNVMIRSLEGKGNRRCRIILSCYSPQTLNKKVSFDFAINEVRRGKST